MRRDRMRMGMHVQHRQTGRYLGVIVDLSRRAVVVIARHGQPDVIATPHEIEPATSTGDSSMPIVKDRPRGGYRRPLAPGDRITTAWGRPLGVVTEVDGNTVRYENADGTEGGTFNRLQVRRVDDKNTPNAKTPAAPAANPKTAPARKLPDRKAPPKAAKAPKVRDLRAGVYQYGGQAALSATQEPIPGRTGRTGNVIRVYAAGREVVVRLTPAGKNATVTVDGHTIEAAK